MKSSILLLSLVTTPLSALPFLHHRAPRATYSVVPISQVGPAPTTKTIVYPAEPSTTTITYTSTKIPSMPVVTKTVISVVPISSASPASITTTTLVESFPSTVTVTNEIAASTSSSSSSYVSDGTYSSSSSSETPCASPVDISATMTDKIIAISTPTPIFTSSDGSISASVILTGTLPKSSANASWNGTTSYRLRQR